MTRNISGGSAKIYEFPKRGRFAAIGQQDEPDFAADRTAPRHTKIVAGGAWYHDAAIQEAERNRKA